MKFKSILAAALCGAALWSCSNNEEGVTPVAKGEPTEITLEVRTGGPATRAETVAGTTKENAVQTIEFYIFDKNGNPDTEVGDAANPGYLKLQSSELSRKIIVSSGEDKKFVSVINMNLGGLGTTGKYADLKKKLSKHEFSILAHNARNENAGEFEMSGETEATILEKKIDNQVRINVKRVVAKINAPIYKNGSNPTGVILEQHQVDTLWGKDCGIDPSKISFNPIGYAVVNGLDRSDAFFISNTSADPETRPWSNWNPAGKTYLNSTFNTDGYYTNNYSGKGSDDYFLDGTTAGNGHRVYVHENKPGKIKVEEQTGYDPLNVYAIMLKGQLVVEGDPTLTKTRYWRVNLTRDDDYHIMRNFVYDVYVQNIKTIGHETPEEAEEEDKIIPGADDTAADVFIDVNEWSYRKYETEV